MKIFFLLSLMILSGKLLALESKEFDGSSIKKLDISNPKGEILVIASPNTKKINVSIEKIQFDKVCHFNLEANLGTLVAKVEHESALFKKANCITKLKIEIPSKLIDIVVSSGSGSIKLVDIHGAIDFSTATGPVEISGDTLKGIEGKSATSNMRISYAKCPVRADVNLVTAAGDAEIFLPTNCKIRVSHKSATGDLFNELGEAEDYQVYISSKSASGNLKIKKWAK
jgi:hypothetical protein